MLEPRHLRNAPITEALVDIKTNLPKDTEPQVFEDVYTRIADFYPNKRQRRKYQGIFQVAGDKFRHTAEDAGMIGYWFLSADEKQIAQFKLDGYTFNKLKPYDTWESLRDEAKRLWEEYVNVALPIAVNRIALRYINRLDIPQDSEIENYLTSLPNVPPEINMEISSFLSRISVRDSDRDIMGIITQTSDVKQEVEGCFSVILDIDVFKEVSFEPKDPSIWLILEELREFKNLIFFSSITQEMASLCD